MPDISNDTIALLVYLLPGFLAAWVLYGLTSNAKPSQFERVIQALIFTFAIHALLPLVENVALLVGKRFGVIRAWDPISINAAKLAIALAVGVGLAYYINTDAFHKLLRKIGLTTRTSYPSEWFGVFSERIRYVVLHLNDDRRLYGWPKEWPTQPDSGHFYIMEPSWINVDGISVELTGVDGLLIPAKDVRWVEFMSEVLEKDDA